MHYEFTFRVDAPGDERQFGSEVSDEYRRRIYSALKLKVFSAAWARIRYGTPKWEEAIALFRTERVLVGTAHFAEMLDEDDEPQSDWSLLYTPQVSGRRNCLLEILAGDYGCYGH